MFETLAMVTVGGGLDRDEIATYLRDSFMTLKPHAENFVWHGWQSAIALLGLSELRSLVKKAFERGLIGRQVMAYENFQSDLKHALAHPEVPGRPGRNGNSLCSATPSRSSQDGMASRRSTSSARMPRRMASGSASRPAIRIETSAATTHVLAAVAGSSRSVACSERQSF